MSFPWAAEPAELPDDPGSDCIAASPWCVYQIRACIPDQGACHMTLSIIARSFHFRPLAFRQGTARREMIPSQSIFEFADKLTVMRIRIWV